MIRARFEFKLADLWIGLFWKRSYDERMQEGDGVVTFVAARRLDLWICLFPCLPLHLVWTGPDEKGDTVPFLGSEPVDYGQWKQFSP